MDTLLRVGLTNAVAAGALALLAAAVGYFCRRPALRHALWLLVLLKLVTPPLIDIPVWRAVPSAEAAAPPADSPEVVMDLRPAPPDDAEPAAPQEEPAIVMAPPAAADEPAAAPQEAPTEPAAPPIAWRPLLAAAWLCGSGLWLLLAAVRARRFARLLRHARPAPAWLLREADELAKRLGLSRAPALHLVPGRVSPMLWAPLWSARLLLPADLLTRLDAAGRRTLLAHELAHLRRGDHRVRLFELVVTGLFWWHPVVWWARRELREAEELCCDAWVLWALPELAKPYALALVETVDFLSDAPAALPALASGMGHVHDLRRRVTMIMQGTTPRALTWGGLLGLVGLGAFLLPVAPSWGQEEEQQPIRLQIVKPDDAGPKQADELRALKAEIEKRRAELAKAEAELRAAEQRLAQAAGAKVKGDERGVIVLELKDGDKRQVIKLPGDARVIAGDPQPKPGSADARVAADKVRAELDAVKLKLQQIGEADQAQPKGKRIVIEIVHDGKRQVIELPAGARVINDAEVPKLPEARWAIPGTASPPVKVTPPPARVDVKPTDGGYKGIVRPADTEKRLADLEKRLEELMRSVKELNAELKGAKPVTPPGAPQPKESSRFEKPTQSNDPFSPATK